MKRWTIVSSGGAHDDILAITDSIARDNSINANNVLDRLEHRIGTLTTLPERGRVVPELLWHGISSIREVFEKPWRILYEISANEVVIVAVYDGRRHMNDVLLERLLR